MTETPKLLASCHTTAGNVSMPGGPFVSPFDLRDRAKAIVNAGYAGMGLYLDDLAHNLDLHGYDGVKAILSDAGIEFLELEVLADWFTDGERRAASDRDRGLFLEAAEKLGAFQIKVIGDMIGDPASNEWPLDLLVESFAQFTYEARDAGTRAVIEIYPASNVRDLATAVAMAAAGHQDSGILLDIWHLTRGNIPYEDIATIPPELIKYIELDDAKTDLVGTIQDDTMFRRELPGDGDFDIPKFLSEVWKTGYDGLYGVEILSDAQRARSVEDAARMSFDATMSQFAAAK